MVTGRPGVLPSTPRYVAPRLTVRALFYRKEDVAFPLLVDLHRLELGSGADEKNVRVDPSTV